jgi:RNA 2',3'-cyclic 3'-phosphodiesterase
VSVGGEGTFSTMGGFRGGFGRAGGGLSPAGFKRPEDDPPGTSRLFIAVPVAAGVRTAVGELMARVAGAPIEERAFGQPRWVRVEGLHLTLRFLGATPDERQPALSQALARVADSASPFDVVLSGGGSFPNPIHPRVLWIGIGEGEAELQDLAEKLNHELVPLGWPLENRPLAPHLTLARTDGVPGADERARRLVEVAQDVRLSWRADRLILYKSIVGRGPTRYEVVSEAML